MVDEAEKTQTESDAEAELKAQIAAQKAEEKAAERAEAKKAAAAARKAKAGQKPNKDGDYPEGAYRIRCTPKCVGSLFDNDRGVRIPRAGSTDVKIAGPIPAGSWLGAQIGAGLVVIVE